MISDYFWLSHLDLYRKETIIQKYFNFRIGQLYCFLWDSDRSQRCFLSTSAFNTFPLPSLLLSIAGPSATWVKELCQFPFSSCDDSPSEHSVRSISPDLFFQINPQAWRIVLILYPSFSPASSDLSSSISPTSTFSHWTLKQRLIK